MTADLIRSIRAAVQALPPSDGSSPIADRLALRASNVRALGRRLQSLPEFGGAGFSLEFKNDAVLIYRGSVLRGSWHGRGDTLVWRSACDGHNSLTARNVETAARQTMLMVLKFLIARQRRAPCWIG